MRLDRGTGCTFPCSAGIGGPDGGIWLSSSGRPNVQLDPEPVEAEGKGKAKWGGVQGRGRNLKWLAGASRPTAAPEGRWGGRWGVVMQKPFSKYQLGLLGATIPTADARQSPSSLTLPYVELFFFSLYAPPGFPRWDSYRWDTGGRWIALNARHWITGPAAGEPGAWREETDPEKSLARTATTLEPGSGQMRGCFAFARVPCARSS